MKVKGVFTSISGSLGGITGSHNKGGQYLRARTVPTNPNSPTQAAARNFLRTVTLAWSALTDAARGDWNAYGVEQAWTNSLGDAIQLSGQQAYVGVNTTRLQAELAITNTPPPPGARPQCPIPSSVVVVGTDVAIEADGTLLATDRTLWAVSRPLPSGQTSTDSPVQILGHILGNNELEVVFTAPWTFPTSTKYVLACKTVLGNGQYSTWKKTIEITAPPA